LFVFKDIAELLSKLSLQKQSQPQEIVYIKLANPDLVYSSLPLSSSSPLCSKFKSLLLQKEYKQYDDIRLYQTLKNGELCYLKEHDTITGNMQIQIIPLYHQLNLVYKTTNKTPNLRLLARKAAQFKNERNEIYFLDGFVYRMNGSDVEVIVRSYQKEKINLFLELFQSIEQDQGKKRRIKILSHHFSSNFGVLKNFFVLHPYGTGIKRDDDVQSDNEENEKEEGKQRGKEKAKEKAKEKESEETMST